VTKVGGRNYYDDYYINIDVLFAESYYNSTSVKTKGFNPYMGLSLGRTFWNALTLTAGYTFAPKIHFASGYDLENEENIIKLIYHAPQIKVGFTFD